MVYRRFRIPVCLAVAILFTTFVVGSIAGRAMPPDVLPSFRIATPGVAEVITQDVTPEIAQALHMSEAGGVLINDIRYTALRPGDVILAINGNRVWCQNELNDELALVGYGQPFSVEVFRDGRTQTVTVQRAMETSAPAVALRGTVDIRGITVASLSNQDGVMVTEVRIGTPASDAGLTSGDIILNVDGHPVRTADEFLGFMRQLNNRSAIFNVLHSNCQIDVFVIPS
jgi:serine protease Do